MLRVLFDKKVWVSQKKNINYWVSVGQWSLARKGWWLAGWWVKVGGPPPEMNCCPHLTLYGMRKIEGFLSKTISIFVRKKCFRNKGPDEIGSRQDGISLKIISLSLPLWLVLFQAIHFGHSPPYLFHPLVLTNHGVPIEKQG